jgi:tetratricopeptide (TPR) repeat protein
MGNLSAAADRYIKVIEQVPGNARAYFGLAQVRLKQQRFDDANTALRHAIGDVGDDTLSAVLAAAHGRDGYRAIERHLAALELDALSERSASGAYVSPLDRARAHARLQHAGEAFGLLDEAFDHRSSGLAFLKVDPAWDNIRHDPRFDRAVRRVPLFHSNERG